jgi:hypothetical protein
MLGKKDPFFVTRHVWWRDGVRLWNPTVIRHYLPEPLSQLVQAITFWKCPVQISPLDIDYPVWSFSWFHSDPPEKFRDNTSIRTWMNASKSSYQSMLRYIVQLLKASLNNISLINTCFVRKGLSGLNRFYTIYRMWPLPHLTFHIICNIYISTPGRPT